jgi:hypothetical protein
MTQQTDKELVVETVEKYAKRLYKFVHKDLEWGHRPFRCDTSFEEFERQCTREAIQLLLLEENLYLRSKREGLEFINQSGQVGLRKTDKYIPLAPFLNELLEEMK